MILSEHLRAKMSEHKTYFANSVQGIYWSAIPRMTHWPIATHQKLTIASILPDRKFIKWREKSFNYFSQIISISTSFDLIWLAHIISWFIISSFDTPLSTENTIIIPPLPVDSRRTSGLSERLFLSFISWYSYLTRPKAVINAFIIFLFPFNNQNFLNEFGAPRMPCPYIMMSPWWTCCNGG